MLLELQDYRCWWHGGVLDVMAMGQQGPHGRSRRPTIDHLVPRALGGPRGDIANQVAACEHCNGRRGSDVHWQPHPRVEGTLRHALWLARATGPEMLAAIALWRRDRERQRERAA